MEEPIERKYTQQELIGMLRQNIIDSIDNKSMATKKSLDRANKKIDDMQRMKHLTRWFVANCDRNNINIIADDMFRLLTEPTVNQVENRIRILYKKYNIEPLVV